MSTPRECHRKDRLNITNNQQLEVSRREEERSSICSVCGGEDEGSPVAEVCDKCFSGRCDESDMEG